MNITGQPANEAELVSEKPDDHTNDDDDEACEDDVFTGLLIHRPRCISDLGILIFMIFYDQFYLIN